MVPVKKFTELVIQENILYFQINQEKDIISFFFFFVLHFIFVLTPS